MTFPKTSHALLLILLVAALLRVWGIARESFWTDEIFTLYSSDHSLSEVLADSGGDIHPPLYFVGLNCWRRVFGSSRFGVRSFGVCASLLGILAVFLLARDIGGRNSGLLAAALAALHPFDIYFAQEARGYMQTAVFGIFGSWILWRWLQSQFAPGGAKGKAFVWICAYVFCALGALFSHYLGMFMLLSQGTFALGWLGWRRKWFGCAVYLGSALATSLLYAPWIFYVLRFKRSVFTPESVSWIPPPAWSEIVQFWGRQLLLTRLGADHAPLAGALWLLPAALIGGFMFLLWRKRRRRKKEAAETPQAPGLLMLIVLIWLPVLLAVTASLLYHPVYHAPRFTIFILPPFLALLGVIIVHLPASWVRFALTGTLAVGWLTLTAVQVQVLEKTNWLKLIDAWPKDRWPTEIVYFPEYIHIAFLNNIDDLPAPAYPAYLDRVLHEVDGGELWVLAQNDYAFDGWDGQRDFFYWLRRQGAEETIPMPLNFSLHIIALPPASLPEELRARFDSLHPPHDVTGQIRGFGDQQSFYILEADNDGVGIFRWSKEAAEIWLADGDAPCTVTLNVTMPPPIPPDRDPELVVSLSRPAASPEADEAQVRVEFHEHQPGRFEIVLPAPPGAGPLLLSWSVKPVNLAREGVSIDKRNLGLRVNWIGLERRPDR